MKELGFFATLSSSSKCFCSIYTTSVFFFPLPKKWCKLGQHEEAKEGIVFVFSGEK